MLDPSPGPGPGRDARVRLVARTEFLPPPEFSPGEPGGQGLAEFAGRACYQSWDRPNPVTAATADYLAHIIEVGHLSILEHSTATFYLTGISRSVAHEILRHRHFSYTELSPRHVPESGLPTVVPDARGIDLILAQAFAAVGEFTERARQDLLKELAANGSDGLTGQQARQLAQRLLAGGVQTSLVMTGNYRAWRHFIAVRATDSADLEIRGLAVAVLVELQREAPAVFADFRISTLGDGSKMAASPLAGSG